MAYPTKNFDITIIYPKEYDIQINPLVINPELIVVTRNDGYIKIKYESWMLPLSGLAWRILALKPKGRSGAASVNTSAKEHTAGAPASLTAGV